MSRGLYLPVKRSINIRSVQTCQEVNTYLSRGPYILIKTYFICQSVRSDILYRGVITPDFWSQKKSPNTMIMICVKNSQTWLLLRGMFSWFINKRAVTHKQKDTLRLLIPINCQWFLLNWQTMDKVTNIIDYLKSQDVNPETKEDVLHYISLLRQNLPRSIRPLSSATAQLRQRKCNTGGTAMLNYWF